MDPSVIHVFFVIMTIAGKPFVGDLYEDRFKFTTMQDCQEYVEKRPDELEAAVVKILPHLSIPDGARFKIAYGCRGKDSI